MDRIYGDKQRRQGLGATRSVPTSWSNALRVPAAWVVGGAMALSLGCASRRLEQPNWGSPGTAQQQQMRAAQYDPYALNDVAPEVVGGRPRDYSKQTPEPVRVDGFRDLRWPF